MYTLNQIAVITNTKFAGNDSHINFFLSDSRTLQSAGDTLFIALKTPRNNGHNYITGLIENGVKAFLVQEGEFDYSDYNTPGIGFIISPDPLKTIQQLAAHHRAQFSIPVIGITGSNGKTVVKEWLYQLLKTKYSICRSPKSYNSQIGVPLSVLNLNERHTLAIFEAGISQPGEMDLLAEIIKPSFGIFTSIGSAHNEGFKTREQKISEKLKLVLNCEKIIINGPERNEIPAGILNKTIFVSEAKDADLEIKFTENLLQ